MDNKTKFLTILSLILFGLGILVIFQFQNFGRLRLVFCDVGQGDGMLLISPGGSQVVVDGGPGTKIVDCLGQKMPFWDRTVEMVVLTHPQKDHMEGLLEVLKRYRVKKIVTTGVKNDTEVFRAWEEAVANEAAQIYVPAAGDRLVADKMALVVLSPARDQIERWRNQPPKDLNETSIVLRVEYQDFCAYLTGDIPKETLQPLIDAECEVLKVSHHGSKTGTNKAILDLANPAVAVIQSGKNSYGHPHKEVLDLLESKGIKILRNDIEGIIELTGNN